MTPGLIDCVREELDFLGAEAVEGLALALEGVDDVEGGDGLAAGVLGVADGVLDDLLEEALEDGAGLLVHEAGDALDAATTSQTADRGLGDALDVVAEHLAVTLAGATLASLATAGHDEEDRVVETLGFELILYAHAGLGTYSVNLIGVPIWPFACQGTSHFSGAFYFSPTT